MWMDKCLKHKKPRFLMVGATSFQVYSGDQTSFVHWKYTSWLKKVSWFWIFTQNWIFMYIKSQILIYFSWVVVNYEYKNINRIFRVLHIVIHWMSGLEISLDVKLQTWKFTAQDENALKLHVVTSKNRLIEFLELLHMYTFYDSTTFTDSHSV